MKIRQLLFGAALIGAAALVDSAFASVTVSVVESGGRVIATMSGRLETASIPSIGNPTFVRPSFLGLVFPSAGILENTSFIGNTAFAEYAETGLPASYGAGSVTYASAATGTVFALGPGPFYLPAAYVSNSPINASVTFTGTFATLGLTPGTYTGTFSDGETITLNIGTAAVPTLPTWAEILLAATLALSAIAALRGRRSALPGDRHPQAR